jgi:hypothetical protein
VKIAAGAFLAGAGSRLLPASIPFRFFGAAVAYHLLAWLALFAGAPGLPRFAGGLGWTLAALHLTTLGVLVMVAIGASLQLLPVATRRPLGSHRWPALIWWVYTPGVAAVALGMGIASPSLLASGAIAVFAALAVYALLLARNLLGSRGMPVVVAHGWAAVVSLLVTLATGVSLACTYVGAPALERGTALALHVAFAAYGFMGMLSLGLSYILVPMFALSEAPSERHGLISCSLAVLALALAGVGAFGFAAQALRVAAIVIGAAAVAVHLRLMTSALRTGLRRELGRSFKLVRIAWGLLVASLALALAVALDVALDGVPTLFGMTLVAGWLLTFLLGILQRIVPFLASMHAARGKGLPPTPSALTDDRSLAIHYFCHLGALALLALSIITDNAWVGRAAAGVGTVGAAFFCGSFAIVIRRMGAGAWAPQARAAQAP